MTIRRTRIFFLDQARWTWKSYNVPKAYACTQTNTLTRNDIPELLGYVAPLFCCSCILSEREQSWTHVDVSDINMSQKTSKAYLSKFYTNNTTDLAMSLNVNTGIELNTACITGCMLAKKKPLKVINCNTLLMKSNSIVMS
jgi:hypothetical protein